MLLLREYERAKTRKKFIPDDKKTEQPKIVPTNPTLSCGCLPPPQESVRSHRRTPLIFFGPAAAHRQVPVAHSPTPSTALAQHNHIPRTRPAKHPPTRQNRNRLSPPHESEQRGRQRAVIPCSRAAHQSHHSLAHTTTTSQPTRACACVVRASHASSSPKQPSILVESGHELGDFLLVRLVGRVDF